MKNKNSENTSKNREMESFGIPFGRLLGHFLVYLLDVGFRLKNGHLWDPRRLGKMASRGELKEAT